MILNEGILLWLPLSNYCQPVPCYLNGDKLFPILDDQYCNSELDSNLGPIACYIAVESYHAVH